MQATATRDPDETWCLDVKMARFTFSSYEDEVLVDLVSTHRPLYDSTLQTYKDSTVKENNWDEIGKILNKSSGDCKKRWKYIKDSYNRCKRKNKLPTGSSASSKSIKWMLYDRLRFLEKVPSERTSESNIETSVFEETNEEDSQVLVSTNLEEPNIKTEISDNVEEISSPGTTEISLEEDRTGKKRKRKQEIGTHETLLKYWKERDRERQNEIKALSVQKEETDVDGINSFCSHIGSILKKLNPALRVEAKSKVFNLLTEYELKSINENARSASSTPVSTQNYSVYSSEDPFASSTRHSSIIIHQPTRRCLSCKRLVSTFENGDSLSNSSSER